MTASAPSIWARAVSYGHIRGASTKELGPKDEVNHRSRQQLHRFET